RRPRPRRRDSRRHPHHRDSRRRPRRRDSRNHRRLASLNPPHPRGNRCLRLRRVNACRPGRDQVARAR
ncbi:MAG: hypothetical protein SFV24_18750, partial [Gemmatimonadales bacterium]|nr:hypothetical protein [Gemmatimonadales bacterium]